MTNLNNTLKVTSEQEKYGIQKIERAGTLKSGFIIEFTINGSMLRIPSNIKIEATFKRVERALAKFTYINNINGYTITDLQQTIEGIFLNNLGWSIGKDLKDAAEGMSEVEGFAPEPKEPETDDFNPKTYQETSIKDAIRSHKGKIKVTGLIASVETETHQLVKEIKWVCHNCRYPDKKKVFDILEIPNKPKECGICGSRVGFENNKHTFLNARILKIQSPDNENNETLETLPVIVLDKHTINIQVNSGVTIYGKLAKKQDLRTKEYYTVLIANLVDYESQKEVIISNKDELDIIKFAEQEDLEEKLIEKIAPHVVGEDFAKLSSLLVAIGAPERLDNDGSIKKRGRGRIHALFIGPPGTGKTIIARDDLLLRLNSKYVSGKNTTAGSLTSMILSEDGKLTLRLGVAATANEAILVINEFDKLSEKDQEAILEVMEEGESILNKYAFLRKIRAKASVIATANPVNGKWLNDLVVDSKELPFSLPMMSRFDILVIFRKNSTKEEIDAYTGGRTDYELNDNIEPPDDFLQKYIEYATRISNVTIEKDAIKLLNEYFEILQLDPELVYYVSNRTWDTLLRLSKAFARMCLTDVVTVDTVERAIDFFREMLAKLNLMDEGASEDFTYCYDMIIEHLRHNTDKGENALLFVNIIKDLANRDKRVQGFLGNVFTQRSNHRVKELWKKVRISSNVVIANKKPIRLYFMHPENCLCDACDACDAKNSGSANENKKNENHKINKNHSKPFRGNKGI